MKRKLLIILIVSFLFSLTSFSSFADELPNTVEVGCKNLCNSPCLSTFRLTISNNTEKAYEDWRLEFDLDSKIIRITNGEIEKHEGSHYVIKPLRHNQNIKPGKKVNITILSKGTKCEPSNLKVNDIYQRLTEKDLQWQAYTAQKQAEAFGLSFFDGYKYMGQRFESDTPFTTYYTMIEKCPVKSFVDNKYIKVKIPTKDGNNLTGVFFPVKKAKGTIIALHGRTCTAMSVLQTAEFLMDNGYQVLAYNGRIWNSYKTPELYMPDPQKDIDDIGSAIDFLKKRKDVDSSKIILYGASLGAYRTAIATNFYKNDIKVAVMDGGFSNYGAFMDMTAYEAIKEPILRKLFNIPDQEPIPESAYLMADSTLSIKNATCPLLFLRGRNDTIIQMDQQMLLYNSATSQKEIYFFENSGHCDTIYTVDSERYKSIVLDFLSRYLK